MADAGGNLFPAICHQARDQVGHRQAIVCKKVCVAVDHGWRFHNN